MSLTKWFSKTDSKGDWVDIGAPKKDGKFQACGRKKVEGSKRKYPKCVPRSKANQMTEGERRSAVKRKRAKAQGVGGKPTNVKTIVKKADGGEVRRNHRGCGAVMSDRRKRTRYS
jgi:hypothetical protein|tara:strand:+ start:698 stop:1042 length:345 start_codon:yes stop_codon:yes gene_type:complete